MNNYTISRAQVIIAVIFRQYCFNANNIIRYKYDVEILERVGLREEPYFRPDISGHDCPEPLSELIQRCWNDVPEERPGFDIMRSIVRQITR